jgi:branched-chain amino acid transport system permease protein
MNRMPSSSAAGQADALAGAVLLLAFASVPLWADKGLIFLTSVLMINVVFALGFNVVFGLTGLVSFGHAAFFAVGAYAAGLLLQGDPRVPFLLILALAALAGALVAAVVAVVALRRSSGIYFAILTLALAELVHILIAKSTLLGREDGLTGIRSPAIDFGLLRLDLAQGNNLYYFTLVVVFIATVALWLLWHNAWGRVLAAIRQDPERTRFLGIDVHRMRFIAFVMSGAAAGLAGGLYAPVAQLLTPDLAHWSASALPILFCLVGGVSYFWGPVVGAIVFIGLEYATRNVVGLSELLIGSILLLVVLAFPGGVIGGVSRMIGAWHRRGSRVAPAEGM